MMFGPRSVMPKFHGAADPAFDWCAWETVRKDENWLISFVDLLIILLATLVVLIGQAGIQHDSSRAADVPSIPHADTVAARPTNSSDSRQQANSNLLPADKSDNDMNFARLVQERFGEDITAVRSEKGVTLEISDAVLFDSAQATLREYALPMLTRLATTLRESGDAHVSVEGHADDRPVHGGRYGSNWELAAARADAVTRFLIGQGFAAGRLRSVSYADTRPTADNKTSQGRAANRRVELRVEFMQDQTRRVGSGTSSLHPATGIQTAAGLSVRTCCAHGSVHE